MGRTCSTHSTDDESSKYSRLLGRIKRNWEDDRRIDFGEMCENVERIHLAPDKVHWRGLVNMIMTLPVPQTASKYSNKLTFRRVARLLESWDSDPPELGTKNHTAGEDQQQFNQPTDRLNKLYFSFSRNNDVLLWSSIYMLLIWTPKGLYCFEPTGRTTVSL
jgi:hypothetical protein